MASRVSIQGWKSLRGGIELAFSPASVVLVCRFLVDADTNEWFDAEIDFDRCVYEEGIADLSRDRAVEIRGKTSGWLDLAPRGRGHVAVRVSNGVDAFVSMIEIRPRDFLPPGGFRSGGALAVGSMSDRRRR